MSWNRIFENPSPVCFDVRSGAGTVRGDGTFSDVVDEACRTPKRHAGWESVEYKGRRYALRGGIRTRHFITLTLPVVRQRDNPMEFTLRAPFEPGGFTPGDKVYADTFSGLVPAVVVEDHPSERKVTLRYTAQRGAYRRGETDTHNYTRVVYRDQVYKTRMGQYRIGPRRAR